MKVSFEDNSNPMIALALPVYDDTGIQVDTTTVNLNQEQIEDIVNAAVRVIYEDRRVQDEDAKPGFDDNLLAALSELDEALTSYSVIEPDNYFPGS